MPLDVRARILRTGAIASALPARTAAEALAELHRERLLAAAVVPALVPPAPVVVRLPHMAADGSAIEGKAGNDALPVRTPFAEIEAAEASSETAPVAAGAAPRVGERRSGGQARGGRGGCPPSIGDEAPPALDLLLAGGARYRLRPASLATAVALARAVLDHAPTQLSAGRAIRAVAEGRRADIVRPRVRPLSPRDLTRVLGCLAALGRLDRASSPREPREPPTREPATLRRAAPRRNIQAP